MFEFELPDLGEGVAEGELLEWHVAPGDHVDEDQVIAEVETDKAAVDVPSPIAGTIQGLQYEPGDVIATGAVLVTIDPDDGDTDGETGERERVSEDEQAVEDDETTTESTSAAGGRVFAPPTVRRLARELGVDITTVDGTGPSGRITESDVRAAAESDDESELKSAVRRVGDDGAASSDDETSDGTQLKSAVRRIGDADEESEPAVESAVSTVDSEADHGRTLATPATRKRARELGVDIDAVPTDQMRDGQPYVDKAAVEAYAAELETTEASAQTTEAAEEAITETTETEPAITDETATTSATGERREPYRGTRRTIGKRMQRSRSEVPHATHHDQAVVPGLVEARKRLKPLAEEKGVRLTYTPFLLKAVAATLDSHPILNTELDTETEEIVYHEAYHIGVATDTENGLVVPVVENVGQKGLLELAREVDDLVERARSRDLTREEMTGGTFTVTNFGAIGGEYADPIINVPETAILGTGALKERPVAEDGEVLAKPTLPLSLAIDHRVIDGADSARFVNSLKEYLADPTRLLL